MAQNTYHDPDRYMVELRQILSQGRKRIGFLIGAGAPVALKVAQDGTLDPNGDPIIPDVAGLTQLVISSLEKTDQEVISKLTPELGDKPNIEAILTRIRRLSQAIGSSQIHGLDAKGYENLADQICNEIGSQVNPTLPSGTSPYTELISWISGTHRDHPVEIFTPNYDLFFEEAFERSRMPYFDGFSGSHKPFFDPTSVKSDGFPSRWSRLWKIHGSLGWKDDGNNVIRTGKRDATKLIYPDHLKYDQATRQPYSALFERLKEFLCTPDTLLICSGFSFFDAHIVSVIDEALAMNPHSAVFAFQFLSLEEEKYAVGLSKRRPNMSTYAKDGAVICGDQGEWKLGQSPSKDWDSIRKSYWSYKTSINDGTFELGDFSSLARFITLTHATDLVESKSADGEDYLEQKSVTPNTAAVAEEINVQP